MIQILEDVIHIRMSKAEANHLQKVLMFYREVSLNYSFDKNKEGTYSFVQESLEALRGRV